MHVNRGLLFWGLALVTAGVVALAVQQGYVDRGALAEAWRLWPLILVALGVSIIVARTPFAILGTVLAALVIGVAGGALLTVGPGVVSCGGDEPPVTALAPHGGSFPTTAAEVDLDFTCGSLTLGMADGTGWTASVGRSRGEPADVESDDESLSIHNPSGSLFDAGRQRWDVTLGTEPLYHLDVTVNGGEAVLDLGGGTFKLIDLNPNAGSVTVDLSEAAVDDFELDLNAGSTAITVDKATDLAGSFSVNAGSIELCTSSDVAMRVTLDANLAFSHNLDESGLNRSGESWSSDGFELADHAIDVQLEGNTGNFTLNPEGGCA
jgi:hypothetical protein